MKALCLYVDGGKGHYVPAKAIQVELDRMGIETRLEEFFDYLDIRWLGRINKIFWRTMLKMPFLEHHISKHNDTNSNGMKSAIKFAKKHCKRIFCANLDEFRPDFIFATHPYASTIIAELTSYLNIRIPVYYFATDVFSAPIASVCNKLNRFYISTEDGVDIVKRNGQHAESVVLAPFPLQQVIAESPKLEKKTSRKKIGLDENLFTLQLNLGGEGIGSLSLLEALIKNNIPMQIVVVGGIDEKMRRKLSGFEKIAQKTNVKLKIAGFINNVQDYLAASDIIAGRAGINTIVEAMFMERPFLITDLVYTVIPSANYIEKYHVGWNCASNRKKQVSTILKYAQDKELLDSLSANFKKIPIIFDARKLAQMLIADTEAYYKEQ